MATRDAVNTIRGYFYQFDYSIIQVLSLSNDDETICVEGIEDVDINKGDSVELHQCKCYEGTEYNHSVIASAVRWMLMHFSENKDSGYNYYIYGDFKSGQQKLASVTLEFVKRNFFTYTKNKQKHVIHSELGLSDEDLLKFLQQLKININAESYNDQVDRVKDVICSVLGCKKQNVEPYYCNALSIIKALSTSKDVANRTISKKEFVRKLKEVDDHYEMWQLHKNGVTKFAKAVKKKYFDNGMNISPYNRFFLIECRDNISITELKTVVLEISKKYSKLRKRDNPKFCPYFYFYGLSDEQLVELKRRLSRDNVVFVDGYDYKGADFNARSITKEPDTGRLVSVKIIDDIDMLDSVYGYVNSTIEIYQFFCDMVYYENMDFKHVKIPFENISDISEMI